MGLVLVDPSPSNNSTSALTSILSCLIPLLVLLYIGAVLWTLDYAYRPRDSEEKMLVPKTYRYAPVAYGFVVIISLVTIALPSWILLQYNLHHNYPNIEARNVMRLILFTACWTSVTAAIFSILFIHPTWSKHPVSSVGTQSIWILLTWVLWIASTGVLVSAIPHLFAKDTCAQLAYCTHIQTLFAFLIVEIAASTVGLLTMSYLAWKCAREIWYPVGPTLPLRHNRRSHPQENRESGSS
ncbi:hypothetical protein FB45DRAFT_1064907 [Roridomyces roridus]|uniref:MARVEL domain-containing protein n=1 Tax=Roridomyces roridus TaxID=1738132 RepID=A0AAD7FDM6_9AGAR|nr:hypothetical protein FB45DRAFT_1064907 [Roridomyces roridus]